jgi:protein gp37
MADKTGIEWTDATWNPVRGCSRVSEGCRNCYAERVAARFSGPGQPYKGLADRDRSGSKWTGRVQLVESALDQPLRWAKPRRIFVNSMSDLFHESLTDGEILRVMMIIWSAPRHTFQVLTKRPERMRAWFKAWNDVEEADPEPKMARGPDATRAAHTSGRARIFASMLESMGKPPPGAAYPTYDWAGGPRWWPTWPAHNLWLGVSVEHQVAAEDRIHHLLATPAARRFLSCEPLLGPVDLTQWLRIFDHCSHDGAAVNSCVGCDGTGGGDCGAVTRSGIHWVIAGGESGPGARPMHPDWARSLRDQCAAAAVPFFFKQWGEWLDWRQAGASGWTNATPQRAGYKGKTVGLFHGGAGYLFDGKAVPTLHTWGEGATVFAKIGKKAAGRLLDGTQHDGFPA